MVRGVDGHRDRILARRRGPAPRHGRGLCVDLDDLARVGQVRVHLPVAGRHAVLRLAAERNIRDERSPARIDHCRGVCVAVEREDAIRWGVEDDRVGVFGRVNPAELLEGFQIEHHDWFRKSHIFKHFVHRAMIVVRVYGVTSDTRIHRAQSREKRLVGDTARQIDLILES